MQTHNQVFESKDHYISFNFGDIYIYGCETTAIVIGQMQRFYILNGDHRENLKNKTLEESIEYFLAHQELKNKNSNNYDETDAKKVIEEYREFKLVRGYKWELIKF